MGFAERREKEGFGRSEGEDCARWNNGGLGFGDGVDGSWRAMKQGGARR